MDSNEIKNYLKRLPTQNAGVYVSDCLPLRIAPTRHCCEHRPTHKGRAHWVALFGFSWKL